LGIDLAPFAVVPSEKKVNSRQFAVPNYSLTGNWELETGNSKKGGLYEKFTLLFVISALLCSGNSRTSAPGI